MHLNYEKKEAINSYINKSMEKSPLYGERVLEVAEIFKEYINGTHDKYNKLVNTLWKKETKHIREVFEGEEYETLKLMLGEDKAEAFKNIWDRATEYIYTTGYNRRSYRTNKSSQMYLKRNIEKLQEFVYLQAVGFTLDKYFADNKADYQYISVIADVIAEQLDYNNEAVLNKIKEIIYSDNNTAIITREIIRGLLMSKNVVANRLLGELLLAAKLQEGLRQAIVESLDEGSREGFLFILKIIIDNNLTRFSSVVRAFGTWTGLPIEVDRPKVVSKCFEAVYNCLTNEAYKSECLASQDNLLIYIGIWAVAYNEVEDIDVVLHNLIFSQEKYKKLVALQFLYETQFTIFKHQVACDVPKENDLETIALTIKNLFGNLSIYSIRENKKSLEAYCKLKDNCHGIKLFNWLKGIVDIMPKKEVEFKGSLFPWVGFKLTTAEIIDKMMLAVANSYDCEVIDTLIDYKEKMSVEGRVVFVEVFLKKAENIKQKVTLIEACGDRSSSVRESAFKIVNSLPLTAEDFKLIENFLQYKSGDIRKSAIKLLFKQASEELQGSVERLINSSNENKRLAAIDIVSAIKGSKEHKTVYNQCLEMITTRKDVSQKEKLLSKNIVKETKDLKSFENGFELYDKTKYYEPAYIEKNKSFNINSVFSLTYDEFSEILNKFNNLIYQYRDYEYEVTNWDDTKIVTTLGGSNYLQPFDRKNLALDNYPISDKIRELAKANKLEGNKILELDFYIKLISRMNYENYVPWYRDLLEENFNFRMLKQIRNTVVKIPYYNKIAIYIGLLVQEVSQAEKFELGKNISEYMYTIIPPEMHCIEYYDDKSSYSYRKNFIAGSSALQHWRGLMLNNCSDDEDFSEYFSIGYNYYKASKYNVKILAAASFGRALELGIIDDNEVYKELLKRPHSAENIYEITNLHKDDRNNLSKYARLIELGNTAVDTIANIEVKRGELNTEVTHLAAKIQKCYGASIFTSIILALEKDTYVRGYNFVSGDCTKKQMLSHLLKCCYPKGVEDAKALGEYLKEKKVSSKQLIEAAMYSPQWLDIVSEYLGYEGLKSACWYFHAHVNDFFSNEKETIVARYTPISSQDLRDGAFDQQWFIDAYNTLGEKNFMIVYDSAKYIARGGLHKRSQLFADATLGKLDLKEIKNRVMDKRNKDYLLTYSLIPIENKKDALERYEYIHQYIKESKHFGAQRQASEGRSANIALLNLARNAGYSDVNRLTWNMETARLDSVRAYLEPYKLEDVEIQLVIDEQGQAELLYTKEGKTLKDIPAKYKKNEYVLQIKELKKSLKNQYLRARQSFEVSMEKGEEFKAEELLNLCENPVLAPIIKNLIFKSGEKIGYLNGDSLVNYKNHIYKLKGEEDVIIAHPVHLCEAGCWSNYQKDIFFKKLVQPFKQVFRELYLPNADEVKEQTLSRRYAGQQVQPKKTAALLKGRGWIISHEEGLQKVYYKENIIATIYAIADWFSPADIEAPTIEFVRFSDRKTYKPIIIEKIPKLIFTEVMRDVDLVVSVAHVGGVDPEASLSTVEIRIVIVDEILKLLKLSNVRLKGSHAYITGVHGEYTVHLGSGVVHKMGTGSINIIPVHSGHRGKIFLPFVDSDPKSAEIISKIIFLAEDKKIKDPSIVQQIV